MTLTSDPVDLPGADKTPIVLSLVDDETDPQPPLSTRVKSNQVVGNVALTVVPQGDRFVILATNLARDLVLRSITVRWFALNQ